MGGSDCEPCANIDVNCDGSTNTVDLGIIRALANFNMAVRCPVPCPGYAGEPRADVNGDCSVNTVDIGVVRAIANFNTATGPCICIDPCDVAVGSCDDCGMSELAGGSGGGSSQSAMATSESSGGGQVSASALTLFVTQPGESTPLATLDVDTEYELHYTSSAEALNMFVLFAAAETAAEGIASARRAANGDWADPTKFAFNTGDAESQIIATGFAPGMYRYQQVVADFWPDETTADGSSGVLCRFTTGDAGTLRLDVTAALLNPDSPAQELVIFTAQTTYTVGGQ